jgi:putative transposase
MTIPVGQSQDFPFALKYLYSIELRFWQISDRFWEVAAHVTVEGAECGLKNKQKLPTAIDLHKRLVSEVKQAYPWYYEVSKCSPQQALRNLSLAFSRWLKQQIARSPKRKKKGVKDSFYLEGSIGISGNLIKLPRIGWVKCHEILPAVTVKNVTISKRAGDWYISFKYEHEIKPTPKLRERIGVDVGINRLATCSDGTEVANVLAYRKAKRRLIQLQRAVTRSRQGSKNRLKAIRQLARQHRRVAHIRSDVLHKLTTWLAKNHSTIVIEDYCGSSQHQLA